MKNNETTKITLILHWDSVSARRDKQKAIHICVNGVCPNCLSDMLFRWVGAPTSSAINSKGIRFNPQKCKLCGKDVAPAKKSIKEKK